MDKLVAGAEKLGIHLDTLKIQQFENYYRSLIEWNRKINLTAVTGYEEVQKKHFLDSLTAAMPLKSLLSGKSLNIIDIGAGAGLPGIPLKIVIPEIRLTLLEATAKKAKFLEHVITVLGLNDVYVISGRAEEIARDVNYREKYGAALSRAVAELPALAELALPFCGIGGFFISYKKGDIREELEKSGKAINLMGGRLKEIIPVSPDLFDDDRRLVIIEKVKNTPPGYPRRPGMPQKRPIL